MNLLEKVLMLVKGYNKNSFVFQAGGSLLSHPTRDFDFLVMVPVHNCKEATQKDFCEYILKNHSKVGDLVEITETYSEEAKETEALRFPMCELRHLAGADGLVYACDGYDVVIKLKFHGVNVDLLVRFDLKSKHDFIFSSFGFFPLSIQHIALDLDTYVEWKSSWQEGEIIFFSCYGKSLDKYKVYYPDRQFKPLPGTGEGSIPF